MSRINSINLTSINHKFRTFITFGIFTLSLITSIHALAFGTQANGGSANSQLSDNLYYNNNGVFIENRPWFVSNNDIYLTGDFKGDGKSELIGMTTIGYPVTVMNQDASAVSGWSAQTVSSLWHFFSVGIHNHLYAVGDFNGDGKDNVLKAQTSGIYQTYEYFDTGNPQLANAYLWDDISYASNGDINLGDKLLSGDFDGDGSSETLLIKPNDKHFTMKFRQYFGPGPAWNWDIIASGATSIGQWYTSSDDKYVIGDFNGDGRDNVLAINSAGRHVTMSFNNNQWSMIEGDASGTIGGANIGWLDHYISDDFDGDGRDEVILVNEWHPWSLRFEFINNAWHNIDHNQGNDYIANWKVEAGDHFESGDFDGDGQRELLIINASNAWQITTF